MNNNLFVNFTCGFGNVKTFVQIHKYAKIPSFDKDNLTTTVAITNLTLLDIFCHFICNNIKGN